MPTCRLYRKRRCGGTQGEGPPLRRPAAVRIAARRDSRSQGEKSSIQQGGMATGVQQDLIVAGVSFGIVWLFFGRLSLSEEYLTTNGSERFDRSPLRSKSWLWREPYAAAAKRRARSMSLGRPKAVSMACSSCRSGTKTTVVPTLTACRVAGRTCNHVSPDRRWKSAMNSTGKAVPVQVPKTLDRKAVCTDPGRGSMPIVGRTRRASATLNSTSTSATWPGSAPWRATAALAMIHQGSCAPSRMLPIAFNDAARAGLTDIVFSWCLPSRK